MYYLKLQNLLDKFEDKFTTIDVYENSKNGYFTFNTFYVVPVRCDIKYIWSDSVGEVEDSFCVDSVTLDTSDNTLTFELANRTKEMVNIDDIISFEVSKISESSYLQAIKQDEDDLRFLEFFS